MWKRKRRKSRIESLYPCPSSPNALSLANENSLPRFLERSQASSSWPVLGPWGQYNLDKRYPLFMVHLPHTSQLQLITWPAF